MDPTQECVSCLCRPFGTSMYLLLKRRVRSDGVKDQQGRGEVEDRGQSVLVFLGYRYSDRVQCLSGGS